MTARTSAIPVQRRSCRPLRPLLTTVLIGLLHLNASSCSTWRKPAEFDVSTLRAQAETEIVNGVKLSASVLSASESKRMFGANINRDGVQPVWIEIDNTTNQPLWLLRSGTDPDLFSPLEVAWSLHKTFDRTTNAAIDAHFDLLGFKNPIPPGATRSGILFTNPHRKTRLLSIDVLGQAQLFPFTLFLSVPDDQSYEASTLERVQKLIAATSVNYQAHTVLRDQLEQAPCCAHNAEGTATGDPINVVLIGAYTDVATALVRRGFRLDVLEFDNAQRLFQRPPDIVARKTGQGGGAANWLRIWVAPFSFRDQTVFLVQAGRPNGWRQVVREQENLVLNPNVDEVRDLLIQDLMYSSSLEKLAFVTGVGATEPGEPRQSLDNTAYHTDGLRAVLFLTTRPLSLSDLEVLDWYPALKLREIEAQRENGRGEP